VLKAFIGVPARGALRRYFFRLVNFPKFRFDHVQAGSYGHGCNVIQAKTVCDGDAFELLANLFTHFHLQRNQRFGSRFCFFVLHSRSQCSEIHTLVKKKIAFHYILLFAVYVKSKKTIPMSLRLSPELNRRLEEVAEKVKQKKHSLAQDAIEAAIEAIEQNDYRLVVPIEFKVTKIPSDNPDCPESEGDLGHRSIAAGSR
jgi:predicted DNA-binding protein